MAGCQAKEGLTRLQGLVRHIGISNFSIKKTQEVLSFCRIRPAVNQVSSEQSSLQGLLGRACLSVYCRLALNAQTSLLSSGCQNRSRLSAEPSA